MGIDERIPREQTRTPRRVPVPARASIRRSVSDVVMTVCGWFVVYVSRDGATELSAVVNHATMPALSDSSRTESHESTMLWTLVPGTP